MARFCKTRCTTVRDKVTDLEFMSQPLVPGPREFDDGLDVGFYEALGSLKGVWRVHHGVFLIGYQHRERSSMSTFKQRFDLTFDVVMT